MKRLLSVILVLCMLSAVLILVPVSSGALTCGDYEYRILDDSTAEITEYTSSGNQPVIPSKLDGIPVTSIGENAFYGCTGLTGVVIPEGVTAIGAQAFYDCTGLESVTIPSTVTSIDRFAFSNCGSLRTITVDSHNPVFDSREQCGAIIETATDTLLVGSCAAVIPEGVTAIGREAFYGCTGLTGIEIPEGVTAIGSRAFYGCTSLRTIRFPDSITHIDSGAFSHTAWFDGMPDGVIYIGKIAYSWKGVCPSTVRIKDGTEVIGDTLFSNLVNWKVFDHLTSVILPDSVVRIGRWAFEHCTNLQSVNIPSGVKSIGDFAFYQCRNLQRVDLPEGLETIGYQAFLSCDSFGSLTVPDSVTSIGHEAIGFIGGQALWGYYDDFKIYGYTGSEAERYARESSPYVKFVSIGQSQTQRTLADPDSGITASIVGQLADLHVDQLAPEQITAQLDGSILAAYDISLQWDEAEIQPNGTVTVTIPCENPNAEVFHLKSDNSVERVQSTYQDGCLIFDTDHFSVYLIVDTGEPEIPTGELICGDTDGDGVVTVFDATAIQRQLVSLPNDSYVEDAADADGDGRISVFDATEIQRHLVGLSANEGIGKPIA